MYSNKPKSYDVKNGISAVAFIYHDFNGLHSHESHHERLDARLSTPVQR